MTVSRVKSAIFVAVCGAGLSMSGAPVLAQQSGEPQVTPPISKPIPLTAPTKPRVLRAPERDKAPEPLTPRVPRSIKGHSVEVDNLTEIDINEAGILVPSTGALGMDMWAGTSLTVIERLLPNLPLNAPSATMRDLMRRLLKSPARIPERIGGAVDGNLPSLISTRIRLLMNIGDLKGAQDLLGALPAVQRDPELSRLEAELGLLDYDLKRVCALAAQEIPSHPEPYWQKIFNFCQIVEDRSEMASLGISLLKETGEVDEAFYVLADSLMLKQPIALETLPNPSPLHLMMAREANAELPADVLSSDIPSVSRAVAISSLASKGLRLEAAERADAAGALPKATLRQLYASVEFTEADRANPLSRAEVEFGPMVRALLYHAALTQTVPTAKAEATSRAFSLARDEGRYASTVQVFEPVLHRIPPGADLNWFAPEAVRAFLVIGDQVRAEQWYQIILSSAGLNEQSRKDLAQFRPVAWLFRFADQETSGEEMIKAWSAAHKDDPELSEKAALLFNVLEALGLDVPIDAWDTYITEVPLKGVTLPSPGVLRRLQTLANGEVAGPDADVGGNTKASTDVTSEEFAGSLPEKTVVTTAVITATLDDLREQHARVGETVLLSLLALGNAGPENTPPFVLRYVLNALEQAGLKKEARELALDAILARGL